ncbi:hemagglutinin repeat-containing protein [Caballeronia sp. AZ1_KS37]|uniref:hemagglutinin repeat-containing protein n=1 Tax=Caballeronia sp. AZ1_KS37 TaxID=2921756 RepID=UPI002028AF3E
MLVQAGRDVINETYTYGVSRDFASNQLTGRVTGTGVDALGTISGTNNVAVIAGRDVNLNGAMIQAGGNAGIKAGRDINVGTTEFTSTREVHTHDGQNGSHDEVSRQLGSAIVAGGKVMTLSERDTTLTGSTIVAGGDLTITASKDTATHHEQSLGGEQSQHISSSYDESVNGSRVSAGGGVTLAAGQNGNGNLSVLGSNVTADQGGVALIASQAADLPLSHGGARPYPLVAGSR